MKKFLSMLSVFILTSFSSAQDGTLSFNEASKPIQALRSTSNFFKTENTHVLKQYSSDVPRTNLVCCSGGGTLNHFSRLFDLTDYGINTTFTVQSVSVLGTGQSAQGDFLEINFAEITGDYNADSVTEGLGQGFGKHLYQSGGSEFAEIELTTPQTVQPGKKLAVALSTVISSNGTNLIGGVFLGNNDLPQTAPSYIGWPDSDCVGDDPEDISNLGFTQSMIFHVTGTTEKLGTVELGSNTLAIYPNPATSELTVSLEGKKIAHVSISNLAGQEFSAKVNHAGKVNIANLNPGVYFLRVTDTNAVTRIQKFIKR